MQLLESYNPEDLITMLQEETDKSCLKYVSALQLLESSGR